MHQGQGPEFPRQIELANALCRYLEIPTVIEADI